MVKIRRNAERSVCIMANSRYGYQTVYLIIFYTAGRSYNHQFLLINTVVFTIFGEITLRRSRAQTETNFADMLSVGEAESIGIKL